MAIISKIYVRFTLKELKRKFSSSFDVVLGSEEGDILFFQIVAMFGMTKNKKKKKEMSVKKNIRYQNFFTNKKKDNHSAT